MALNAGIFERQTPALEFFTGHFERNAWASGPTWGAGADTKPRKDPDAGRFLAITASWLDRGRQEAVMGLN